MFNTAACELSTLLLKFFITKIVAQSVLQHFVQTDSEFEYEHLKYSRDVQYKEKYKRNISARGFSFLCSVMLGTLNNTRQVRSESLVGGVPPRDLPTL